MRFAGLALFLLFAHSALAAKVTTQSAETLAIYPQFSAPATVLALHDSEISSEVAGQVVAIAVEVGDRVAAGDLLLSIDPFNYQQAVIQNEAALESLAARIELAEYQLKQANKLSQQRNVSEELLVQRKVELASLQAEQRAQQAALAQAKRNLQKTRISAPFAGVVSARTAQLGAQLEPGKPVLRLVSSDNLEISAQLQAEDARLLAQVRQLAFHVNGQRFPVTLRTITPLLDALTRTQEARLQFVDHHVLPGSSGRLRWQHPQPHLPADLLLRRDGKLGVFLAEQGKARFVPLPRAQEGRSVALEGLESSAQVIIDGRYALQDGDSIELP